MRRCTSSGAVNQEPPVRRDDTAYCLANQSRTSSVTACGCSRCRKWPLPGTSSNRYGPAKCRAWSCITSARLSSAPHRASGHRAPPGRAGTGKAGPDPVPAVKRKPNVGRLAPSRYATGGQAPEHGRLPEKCSRPPIPYSGSADGTVGLNTSRTIFMARRSQLSRVAFSGVGLASSGAQGLAAW